MEIEEGDQIELLGGTCRFLYTVGKIIKKPEVVKKEFWLSVGTKDDYSFAGKNQAYISLGTEYKITITDGVPSIEKVAS